MKKELTNYGFLALIGILLFSIVSCNKEDDPEPDDGTDPQTELSITSFTPEKGEAEDTVMITGIGFSETASQNKVYFKEFTSQAAVISATATSLSVQVPGNVSTGPIIVVVGADTAISSTNFALDIDTTPMLTSISKASGRPGDIVEITGTHFSTTLADVRVLFGDTEAGEIVTASTTKLTVSVPAQETYTEAPLAVSVEVKGVTSGNTLEFTIIPPLQKLAAVYWGSEDGFINKTTSSGTSVILDADNHALYGIALDNTYDNVYYVNKGTQTVNKGSTGGFVEGTVLYSTADDGLVEAYDIALDEEHNAIYIVDLYDGKILKGSLDGTAELTTIYDVGNFVGFPSSVKLHVEGDALYWTEPNYGGQRIMKGSLDGTATAEEIISTDVAEQGYQGLAIDAEAGKIYYAEVTGYFPPVSKIYVANLTGEANPTLLFDQEDGVSGAVHDIEIDLENGYLYWMNQENEGELMRGLLDGSGETDVIFDDIASGSFFDIEFTRE